MEGKGRDKSKVVEARLYAMGELINLRGYHNSLKSISIKYVRCIANWAGIF